MRNLIIISTIILLSSISGYSQTPDYSDIKRNSIYVEGYFIRHAFNSGFVSINYERSFFEKRNINVRLGIYPDYKTSVSFPLTVSWLSTPLSPHHFEFGIGGVFRIEHYVDPNGLSTREWFYDIPAVMIPVMYRYQKGSGWFLRGGVNLFISWPSLLSPSISAGYKF